MHILAFLGLGDVQRYIKSDELFARSIVVGELIRQAERLVFRPVQQVCVCVCARV